MYAVAWSHSTNSSTVKLGCTPGTCSKDSTRSSAQRHHTLVGGVVRPLQADHLGAPRQELAPRRTRAVRPCSVRSFRLARFDHFDGCIPPAVSDAMLTPQDRCDRRELVAAERIQRVCHSDHAITSALRCAAISGTATHSAGGQREALPRLAAFGVRVVFDTGMAVENLHRPICARVRRPVVAGHAGAGECPPACLHVIADAKRRSSVCGGGDQHAELRAVDVEYRQQLGGMGGAKARPTQGARRVVVAVQVGGRMLAVCFGDLPGRRSEREVATKPDTCRRIRIARVRRGNTFALTRVRSRRTAARSLAHSSAAVEETLKSLASSALVPTISGMRCAMPSRMASTGSSGR